MMEFTLAKLTKVQHRSFYFFIFYKDYLNTYRAIYFEG